MSHVVSLCSQRCTCGRLIQSLHWLENECEERNVCGVMEMRLALDIAWAGALDVDVLMNLMQLLH